MALRLLWGGRMHIGRTLALVLPLLAAFACGGVVEPGPDGGGGSSSGGSSGSSSGGVTCPGPQSVQPGVSCSAAGLTCPSDQVVFCAGGPGGGGGGGPSGPIQCTCTDGSWLCPTPDCPPPVECPLPAEVMPGASCDLPPDVSCHSATPICNTGAYAQCQCLGDRWVCQSVPDCPDAGTCPPPQQVQQGVACHVPAGQACPGNPQVCGGEVDYDAFECQSGVWTDVAATVCAIDGGAVDGGTLDGI